MHEKIIKDVERKLDHWAHWCLRCGSGLGYHRENILEQYRKCGVVWQKQPGRKQQIPEDLEAEKMEKVIRELRDYKRCFALLICEQYLGTGTMQQKAARLDLSYRRYKEKLDQAHHWIAGRCVSVTYYVKVKQKHSKSESP